MFSVTVPNGPCENRTLLCMDLYAVVRGRTFRVPAWKWVFRLCDRLGVATISNCGEK